MATPNPDDLKKQIEEIRKLSKLLNEDFKKLNLKPVESQANEISSTLIRMRVELEQAEESAAGMVINFKQIVQGIGDSNKGLNDTRHTFRTLSSLATQIQEDQRQINKLNEQDLKTLIKKAEQAKNKAKFDIELLNQQKNELHSQGHSYDTYNKKLNEINSAIQEANDLLNDQNKDYQKLISDAQIRLDQEEKIRKGLGLTGSILKGISKIPFLGDIVDTKEALESATETLEGGKNSTQAMSAAVKNLGSQLKTSLADPLVVIGFLATQIWEALVNADKATGELAKEFNISYNEAANLREELIQIGNLSGNVVLNARALQESLIAIGKSLGSNATLNEEDLITFTELREMAGYTNEELVGIQKLTLSIGGTLKDNTKQFLGTVSALNAQNKLTVNQKQLLKEVSNTSAIIKLSIGGTTEQLAKAAFQAKQFGINLEQANSISGNLLDFESSISNEISAELITGKMLNLEKARLLALNGDIAGASSEILNQVKGTAEYTRMNRIQQEALAKSVGLSRDELAASLIEREALQKIGVKDSAEAKERFDLLVKEKGYTEAIKELGDEDYARQLKQQSVAERFNNSIEKMKELFISIAEPVLQIVSPLIDLVNIVLPAINYLLAPIGEGFRAIGVAINYIQKGWDSFTEMLQPIMPVLKGIGYAALALLSPFIALAGAAAFISMAGIPIVGPVLATAAALGAVSFLTSKLTGIKIQDGIINPQGGLVVSGEKGSIQLDKNDSIIAGTDLNKSSQTINNNSTIDLEPLLMEMKGMRNTLNQLLNKEGNVYMDSNKVGTAFTISSYKIQ